MVPLQLKKPWHVLSLAAYLCSMCDKVHAFSLPSSSSSCVSQIHKNVLLQRSFFTATSSINNRRTHANICASATETTPPSNEAQQLKSKIDTTNENNKKQKADVVVVGAGPAGLLTAIMLSQKYPSQTIHVYDRLNEPPSPTDNTIWSDVAKFYLIGLGSRGQKALAKYGVWEDCEKVCTTVVGRKDWSPESDAEDGVERIFTDRPVMTQVLPRDKLVGVMHQHVLEHYNDKIVMNYGYEIVPEDFEANDNTAVKIRVSKCNNHNDGRQQKMSSLSANDDSSSELCDIDDESFLITTGLLIAADGTSRTIANAMEEIDRVRWGTLNPIQKLTAQKPFHVKRYVDDNRRIYKTIPMKIPDDWRPDLNYSARTKDGRINYDALPADRNGNYCGVLLIKDTDEFAAPNTDPKKLRLLLDENLPQFSCLLDDKTVEEIAKKDISYLPSFRYAGPRLNQGDRTLIIGDSAHTVKPYFGLGANSALEDVKVLEEAIDASDDIPAAVHLFSKRRAVESKSLVKLSRELDRPGKLGLLTFLIPIILDGIFNKIFPKIFAPNTIAMLQKEGITFTGVRVRKRMDRLGQLVIIGTGATGVAWGVKCLLRGLSKFISASPKAGATVVGVIAVALATRMAGFFNPNLAPADVMPNNKSK
jgi:2-polyprenyl-6-methoxyphenol hydroxylase-like FAD-dependent oxidoreductase